MIRSVQRLLGLADDSADRISVRVHRINDLEATVAELSDARLRESMDALRVSQRGETEPETLTDEVFASCREAARRRLGLRPYDEQIAAGVAMAGGKLAELDTGEGKTLAAVPVACLLALTGAGVHVLTFNDYLAKRDAAWMGPIYEALGFSVGVVSELMTPDERRAAYSRDVTYLTAKQAGFDHLRDGLAPTEADVVQRELNAAIIDEADSILIDEARVPLVIAGRVDAGSVDPVRVARVVAGLAEGRDYDTDPERRNVHLTDAGLARVEAALGVEDLYDASRTTLVAEIQNGLMAHALLSANVDYIVRDGRVELVDELTGRVVADRLWPDGLQAAIEAKEGVPRRPEGRILGSTTLQHFVGRYRRLCGMTATAAGAKDELKEFYDLEIQRIPPHRPCIRVDHPDRVFGSHAAKQQAVIHEIETVHATRRPILLGTASVAESEAVASALADRGIDCAVLNARNDAAEAGIIAEAGKLDAVTISTNMAGRGTDIRLGGVDGAQRERVEALGGLHVVGMQRHESRRIDDQLRGRAGRQGDPGSSRFFASLEDDLLRRFGDGAGTTGELDAMGSDESLRRRLIHNEIARAQRIVDGQNLDIRRTLHDYSSFLNRQRDSIQEWRRALLAGTADTPLFEKADPRRFRELRAQVGAASLADAERRITLRTLDRAFSDHLGRLDEIRDSIHLSRAAGRGPLDEFHRRAGRAFEELVDRIEREVGQSLSTVRITGEGLDYEGRAARPPSSTWTYTVNDDPFEINAMACMAGSIGMASGMAILWPLTTAWALWVRYERRKRRRRE